MPPANDFGLFVGTRRTRGLRNEQQMEFYRYLAEKRDEDPELHVYVDETGCDPKSRFVGVGGICILDSRSYEMRHAALRHWRDQQGWVETLHFADIASSTEHRHLSLLTQLKRHRAGLLFLGHATIARGNKDSLVSTLFVQMIGDALQRADQQGCLGDVRAVRVLKEASEGFDALHLPSLKDELSQHLLQLFPNRVYLKSFHALPKGREVMLECADTIASAMRRRWSSGNNIHKDRVAESTMNVTGFGDSREGAAVYKIH